MTKSNQSDTENTEISTELNTESASEISAADVATTEDNAAFDAFADKSMTNVGQDVDEQIEEITEEAAAVLIAQAAQAIIGFIGMISGIPFSYTDVELECLGEDLAPVFVKYGANVEQMPPWMKWCWDHRVEFIATKAVFVFGWTGYQQFKVYKEEQRLERERLRIERIKAETAAREAAAREELPMAA